jgi:hypothetical protein
VTASTLRLRKARANYRAENVAPQRGGSCPVPAWYPPHVLALRAEYLAMDALDPEKWEAYMRFVKAKEEAR